MGDGSIGYILDSLVVLVRIVKSSLSIVNRQTVQLRKGFRYFDREPHVFERTRPGEGTRVGSLSTEVISSLRVRVGVSD